ncbi:MAG: superoxide dismutase [Bacteroidales bacterium]|nr:superoxide dismutase [Bacteroidales bacterium]
MSFELPQLPYALDALAPAISKKTLEFHYGKHHQAYVNNLNGLIPGTPYEQMSLEEIIKSAEGGIFNNAAQIWNHSFYFSSFSPQGGGEPEGLFLTAIQQSFGSYAELKDQFSKAAASLFGSGWAWLVRKNNGALKIIQGSNAENPLREGLVPILTCDVWEHAYYLDYQNRRPDYIKAFWDIIDWKVVGKRF